MTNPNRPGGRFLPATASRAFPVRSMGGTTPVVSEDFQHSGGKITPSAFGLEFDRRGSYTTRMKSRLLHLPAFLLLGSCMLGPDFKLPAASGGTHWKETRNLATRRLPDAWWKLFADAELLSLIHI